MYELVGWSLLVDKMKTYYDALHCNDCDTKQIADCIKKAMNDFGSANRMDAIDWRAW